MPDTESLRLRTGQLVTEDWYDALVDFLEQLGYGGVISAYGYVVGDLVPIQDLLLNLGIPLKRFKELWAGYGYFSYDLFVQGMRVIKDGDPITVDDLGSSAVTKITTAVDNSKMTGYTQQLHPDLVALLGAFKPVELGHAINLAAGDMTDCFGSDLTALYDGRFRFQFVVAYNVYAYVAHTHTGQATQIVAALNAGAIIPVGAWHEFDFTCLIGDKANFRITPSTTLSIVVYNIPNT